MKTKRWRCRRCKAKWLGRKAGKPLRCPRCSTARWDAPPLKAFVAGIEKALDAAGE